MSGLILVTGLDPYNTTITEREATSEVVERVLAHFRVIGVLKFLDPFENRIKSLARTWDDILIAITSTVGSMVI